MSEEKSEYLVTGEREFMDFQERDGLKWADTPTDPGYYWMKRKDSDEPAIIKKVDKFGGKLIINGYSYSRFHDGMFYGPLVEPK